MNAPADDTLHFPLLDNALDFLESAVEGLEDPTPRHLKYAVLHLGAGLELLLKERLRIEDWRLLFDDIDAADELKLVSGDFYSVGPPEALGRLRDIGVVISPEHEKTLTLLRQKRNRIQHFAVIDSQASVETVTAGALGFALDFISNEIEDAGDDPAIADQIETLRRAVTKLDAFVRQRWKEITPLVEAADTVITCVNCGEAAAVIDDGVRCLFCGYSTDADDAAHRYASEVLGVTLYDAVTRGGEYPVYACPECEYETLVDRGGGEQPRWFCTTCGHTWDDGDLDNCLRCGRLYADNGMSICSECFEEQVQRD